MPDQNNTPHDAPVEPRCSGRASHGSQRRDFAREVRSHLADPVRLCAGLGLLKDSRRQIGGGLMIRCPLHVERSPSCSVTRGPDGTIRVRCFGCGWTGDALSLIADVRGLSVFRDVLREACRMAGLYQILGELDGDVMPFAPPAPAPPPVPAPKPRDYPPAGEVRALWYGGALASDDAAAGGYLLRRMIDPDLAPVRAIRHDQRLSVWARFRGRAWYETGHRLIVPVFDAAGLWRSVRAIRITDGDTPKRLPPAGHRAAGLVLANRAAILMLRGDLKPERLIVAEGEPDWLTWTTRTDHAVVGVLSGAWTAEHAARVPAGCVVVIRTHADEAGEHYAAELAATLGHARLWRAA